MFNDISIDTLAEVLVRVVLWILYLYLEHANPFIRDIQPDEAWLYRFPKSESYVPAQNLWFIIVGYPALVCLLEYWLTKRDEGPKTVFKALTFSYALTGLLTAIMKMAVGRPRPDFISRCFPNSAGSDFTKCTGDEHHVRDGRKSFPSGHASMAFTCMMFMCLYQAKRMNFATFKTGKAVLCVVPLVIASLIAISRTCDYHHHYQDVAGGSMLGILTAYVTYNLFINDRQLSRLKAKCLTQSHSKSNIN